MDQPVVGFGGAPKSATEKLTGEELVGSVSSVVSVVAFVTERT